LKKILNVAVCCLCVITVAAQSNQLVKEWEQRALSKSAQWSHYTQTAIASDRQTYVSLYINGRHVASFNDIPTCSAKKSELRTIAVQMFGDTHKVQIGNLRQYGGSAYEQLRQIATANGVDINAIERSTDKMMQGIYSQVSTIIASENKKMLQRADNSCVCRTERNPNYKSSATDNNLPKNDLFGLYNHSDENKNQQQQYDITDIFDMPSGRNIQSTSQGATPSVSLNFDDVGGIDPNAKPQLFEHPPVPEVNIDGVLEAQTQKRLNRIEVLDPFDLEALSIRKKKLEDEKLELFSDCIKRSKSDCIGQFKPMDDKIDFLNRLIAGGGIAFIDKKISENQEKSVADRKLFENDTPWENISASIDNSQRLTTVMNQLVALNSGEMPKYIGQSGDGLYHFKGEKKGTLFFVDKDGGAIEFVKEKIQNPLALESIEADFMGAGIKVKTNGDVSVTGTLNTDKIKGKGEIGKDGKVTADISTTVDNWVDENKKVEIKNWELIKLELKGKTGASLELSRVNIFENGSAIKTTATFEAGKWDISGKAEIAIDLQSAPVSGSAKVDLASAKGTVAYIHLPEMKIKNDDITITQKEIFFSAGLGASVGVGISSEKSKKKDGKDGEEKYTKVESSALVKAGVGFQYHDTYKNINYLPKDIQKEVVHNILKREIYY
jgi:hypothetical protein